MPKINSSELGYVKYRERINELVKMKRQLVIFQQEKLKFHKEYLKMLKKEKELREKLMNLIPNRFVV